jgi:hypothetical protein
VKCRPVAAVLPRQPPPPAGVPVSWPRPAFYPQSLTGQLALFNCQDQLQVCSTFATTMLRSPPKTQLQTRFGSAADIDRRAGVKRISSNILSGPLQIPFATERLLILCPPVSQTSSVHPLLTSIIGLQSVVLVPAIPRLRSRMPKLTAFAKRDERLGLQSWRLTRNQRLTSRV